MSIIKKTGHADEQRRADVKESRRQWFERMLEFDCERLVFVDETAVTTSMARRYGRSKRGQRLYASVPHGHRKTLTTVAAIRSDAFVAQQTVDGAMNTGALCKSPKPIDSIA